jgi:predicted Zn-dependent peptidase
MMTTSTIPVIHCLANGLTIVIDTIGHIETVTLGLWARTGSRFEAKHENGLAHFFEHMVFKGTTTRTALQIAEQIEDVGGYLNAYTAADATAYYTRVLRYDVALGLDLICDILLNPSFPEEELERERGVIIQEIGMYHDDPQEHCMALFQQALFGDHPLGWNPLGPVDIIKAMPRQAFFDFKDAYYHPNNLILSIAGNITPQAAIKMAEERLGHLVSNPTLPKAISAAPRPTTIVEKRPALEQATVAMGFVGVPYGDEEIPAQVLAMILGGGLSSRLFQEIREKRGLAYDISMFSQSLADTGIIGLYAGTDPDQVDTLLEVARNELIKVCEDITEVEIARAKAQIRAKMVMSLESSTTRCQQLAHDLLQYGRLYSIADIEAELTAVTRAGLGEMARRLFTQPEALAIVQRG